MQEEQSQYLNKRERRQQRKEQKRREIQRARSARMFRNYAAAIVIIAIIVVAGYGIYLLARSADSGMEDFSRSIPLLGVDHIAVSSQLPQYNSNPPTSGSHYGQTARSGFREETIPDQHIIHNLEHGDIWIAYHPRVSDEVKQELKQFAAAKVIITPREANDTDIALAAWGRLDTFDVKNNTVPIERIKDFIKRYANKGPEKIPGASGGI